MQKARKHLNPSLLGFALAVTTAVVVIAARPFSADLGGTAHLVLGGVMVTLAIWIFKPIDLSYSAGGLFLGCFMLAIGVRPAVVFSGFVQPAVWTLVPALFFGYSLAKAGLGRRVALAVMRLVKPSYPSLVLAWVAIGLALSALTPSITVRVSIVMPIAVECSRLCGLEAGSRGNSLILLTAFAMALLPGAGWLSGSLWGPILTGMYDATPGLEGLVTFDGWLGVMLLPAMMSTALLVAGSLALLAPKEPLPQEALDAIKAQAGDKIGRDEAVTAIVLVAVFAGFLTSRLHGVPDAALCLAAVFTLFAAGVLTPTDFNTGINWELVFFIAMALGLGPVFAESGVSQWLASIVVPVIAIIAANPWLFAFTMLAALFAWRFLDVAMFIPTIAIMVPILPAIQDAYHVNPLVWLPILVMAANCFFMAYQNLWAMMGRSIAGDRAWPASHMAAYGLLYFASCLLTMLAAVPMWMNAGLFG
jgi:di/tricarboxylate transporter